MNKQYRFILLVFVFELIASTTYAQSPQFPLVSGSWIGGDGAYSITLNDTTRLWLFGDTWVGQIKDNKRYNATMVNNSVAIDRPAKPMQYYVRSPKTAIFINPRKGEWYWPSDGICINNILYVLVSRLYMKDSTNKTGFGFANAGQDMAVVHLDGKQPTEWIINYNPIPENTPRLGVAVTRDERYVYLFGDDNTIKHTTYLARVPVANMGNLSGLEYYHPKTKQWKKEFSTDIYLFDAAPEFSVRYDPEIKKWIVIYTRKGMSKDIAMRTAKNITGPWSDERVIAECPEMAWNKNYYAYEAKQIAPLKGDNTNKLILTYLVNALSLWDVANDTRIYVPQVLTLDKTF
ncbi:MAG: DUF4185 domain-containing protein [Sphingobacteriaceae bacterium]|nr:MAG: DUF4185 domain-containing protein [Sphingobacteriaceae bacterium]